MVDVFIIIEIGFFGLWFIGKSFYFNFFFRKIKLLLLNRLFFFFKILYWKWEGGNLIFLFFWSDF